QVRFLCQFGKRNGKFSHTQTPLSCGKSFALLYRTAQFLYRGTCGYHKKMPATVWQADGVILRPGAALPALSAKGGAATAALRRRPRQPTDRSRTKRPYRGGKPPSSPTFRPCAGSIHGAPKTPRKRAWPPLRTAPAARGGPASGPPMPTG